MRQSLSLLELPEKFAAKIFPEPMSGCWLWIGSNKGKKARYGEITVNGNKYMATHAVLELSGRPLSQEKPFACHSCDNPSCVNPDHLFWGTQQDNVNDMIKKGRQDLGGLPLRRIPRPERRKIRTAICWRKERNKFSARVTLIGEKTTYLGLFTTRRAARDQINIFLSNKKGYGYAKSVRRN